MESFRVFPNAPIDPSGKVSDQFMRLGIDTFQRACSFVYELPYGYNSDRDDLMILFKEKQGSCTTKHAVIATLANELKLPVEKNIGVYAMTEAIVTGTDQILEKYDLPYVPMVHCFLACNHHRVDLTEGNANGKNQPIDAFLITEKVIPNISAKDEYLKYRKMLKTLLLKRDELKNVDFKAILHAREEGIALLKSNIA
jgi:hypothetical protein